MYLDKNFWNPSDLKFVEVEILDVLHLPNNLPLICIKVNTIVLRVSSLLKSSAR